MYAQHIRHRCKPLTHGRHFFTGFDGMKIGNWFSLTSCHSYRWWQPPFRLHHSSQTFSSKYPFSRCPSSQYSHSCLSVTKSIAQTPPTKWQFCRFNEQRENKQNGKIKMIKFKRNRKKESLQIDYFFFSLLRQFRVIKDSLWSSLIFVNLWYM